jgi:AcrR family transcriptional regulator
MHEEPKGRERWLAAGQELLRQGGVAAVKQPALTKRLGLTTGSFYHHFSSMADYLDQLAAFYGSQMLLDNLATVADADPRRRLRHLVVVTRDEQLVPLDAAMRDWAGTNPIAAESVRSADRILFRFIERAFLDLGYDRRSARVRTMLFYSPGVARVSPPWRLGAGFVDDVLEILAAEPE